MDGRANEFLRTMQKKELLDKLWDVIKEEWDNLSPEGLYSIAEHKLDIARAVLAADGKKILKEPHGGTTEADCSSKSQQQRQCSKFENKNMYLSQNTLIITRRGI